MTTNKAIKILTKYAEKNGYDKVLYKTYSYWSWRLVQDKKELAAKIGQFSGSEPINQYLDRPITVQSVLDHIKAGASVDNYLSENVGLEPTIGEICRAIKLDKFKPESQILPTLRPECEKEYVDWCEANKEAIEKHEKELNDWYRAFIGSSEVFNNPKVRAIMNTYAGLEYSLKNQI